MTEKSLTRKEEIRRRSNNEKTAARMRRYRQRHADRPEARDVDRAIVEGMIDVVAQMKEYPNPAIVTAIHRIKEASMLRIEGPEAARAIRLRLRGIMLALKT